jgi:hypothetical protein
MSSRVKEMYNCCILFGCCLLLLLLAVRFQTTLKQLDSYLRYTLLCSE